MFFGNLPPVHKYKILLIIMGCVFGIVGELTRSPLIMCCCLTAVLFALQLPEY